MISNKYEVIAVNSWFLACHKLCKLGLICNVLYIRYMVQVHKCLIYTRLWGLFLINITFNDFINSIIDIYLTFLYDYRETADVTDHDRLLVSDGGSSTDAVTRLFKQYKRLMWIICVLYFLYESNEGKWKHFS